MASSSQVPPFGDGDTIHEHPDPSTDATKEHSRVATASEDDSTSQTKQQDTFPSTEGASYAPKELNSLSPDTSSQAATQSIKVDAVLNDNAEKEGTHPLPIPASSGETIEHTESKEEISNPLPAPENDYSFGRTPTQHDPMPNVNATQPAPNPGESNQNDPPSNKEDIPSNYEADVQEAEQLLQTRLEMGFNKSIDIHVRPESLERTASTAPIPPSTPQEITSSDESEIQRVSSPDINEDEGSAQDTNNQQSNTELHHVSVGSVKVPVIDTEHQHLVHGKPAIVRLTTDQLAKFDDYTANAESMEHSENKEEDKATPVLPSRQISEEPQAVTATEAEYFDIVPATAEPSPAISSEVDSTASVVPIPPTTPQSNLDSVQSDHSTPKTTSENQITLQNEVPRLEVTASDDHDLSFVDDARSERSVGTSVAPIAPNSPRFISPLPTPSLDSDAFTSYEQAGRESAVLRGINQPLTERAIGKLPEIDDPISELAPELKDALASPLEQNNTSPLDERGALNTIPEHPGGSTTEPSMSRPIRPRQPSSPSTGSMKKHSGWLNSTFPARRMSMEIVEGQFSQPLKRRMSAEQTTQGEARVDQSHKQMTKDDGRCIIM
ncbi:hypothetical protein CPB86DRAFT_458332 [Serendipita vermifera]|nr:hypothetical protein CPB86DRAFT_458332 [Serendipita vermifera]